MLRKLFRGAGSSGGAASTEQEGNADKSLHKFWRWLTTSRYTLSLEREIDRLRGELRLWQDAALRREGLPRLMEREESKHVPLSRPRMLPSQYKREFERRTQPKEEKAS